MRTFWRKFWQYLDKAIYQGRYGQFIWLGGALVIAYVFLNLLSLINGLICHQSAIGPIRILELLLDPGSFVDSEDHGPVLFQFFTVLVGAVLFTSFLIGAIGNLFGRRIEAITKGQYSYRFKDHILILGSNSMLINVLRNLTESEWDKNEKRDIVIQTTADVEQVRERCMAELSKDKIKNIYVVYGNRTYKDSLEKVHASDAKAIYILGEEDEPQHDGLSLKCWIYLKSICVGLRTDSIECFLVLDRISSVYTFINKEESKSTESLKLNVVNATENSAQQVLVTAKDGADRPYPRLDRKGIDKDSEVGVHFVVVGEMTQMAYSMATTAAHICHFPNFITKRIRTKITFIQKNIKEEFDFFRSHYQSLMDLSYCEYVYWDSQGNKIVDTHYPKPEYCNPACSDPKGFLDVEWEFIDAGVEYEQVREYIKECALKNGITEYLSLAFCDNDPEVNVAAAMYLPYEVFQKCYDVKDAFSEFAIPIFVYQPLSGYVVRRNNENSNDNCSVGKFSNMFPIGVKSDCFVLTRDRLAWAQRVNYIYEIGPTYSSMNDEEAKRKWYSNGKPYTNLLSSQYSANSIPAKLRSLGMSLSSCRALEPDEKRIMAEVEHNRWNVEKLLTGFRALTWSERFELDMARASSKTYADLRIKQLKNEFYTHPDIVPFDELNDGSKEYDYLIVSNILDIINK